VTITLASSPRAADAYALVLALQHRMVSAMQTLGGQDFVLST
jgi:hypothetical protein